MPAIITDKLKRTLSQQIFDENQGTSLGDSNNYYYIGVGHSQIWQTDDNTDITPTPSNSERDRRLFRYNLQSVKAVEAFSFVVPLTEWSTSTVYPSYINRSETNGSWELDMVSTITLMEIAG